MKNSVYKKHTENGASTWKHCSKFTLQQLLFSLESFEGFKILIRKLGEIE